MPTHTLYFLFYILSHRNGRICHIRCPSGNLDTFLLSHWKKCGKILSQWHLGGPKDPSQVFLLSRLYIFEKMIPVTLKLAKIVFHAYCSSHFSCKIPPQSNFVQHFVPAEYFTQIIVTFDFSTQNSFPVNLRANFLSQSIILDKNLVPVEIYLCPRQNIA